jgi:O-antigen ligase/GT2 family glycosyltransferase
MAALPRRQYQVLPELSLRLAAAAFVPVFAAWSLSFFIPFFSFGNALLKGGLAVAGASLVFALAAAGRASLRRRAATAAPFLAVGVIFLAWLAATSLWATAPAIALSQVWKYAICLGIFAGLMLVVETKGQIRLIVAAFIAGAALSALCGLLGYDGTPVNALAGQSRIQGGAGDPNVLAAAVLAAAILAGGLMPGVRRSGPRLMLMATIVVFGLTLAGTESRGGAIATIIVIALALVVMRGRRRSVLGFAAAGLAAAAAWLVLSPGSAERLTNFNDHGNGRDELWRIAGEMFSSHPIGGVGLQNFVTDSPGYVLHPGAISFIHLITERPVVVHNTYLQYLAETGLVGLLLFLTLVALSLAASLRAASIFEARGDHSFADLSRAIFLALVALLAAGFFFSSGIDNKLWLLLGLGPVVLMLARRGEPAPAVAGRGGEGSAPAVPPAVPSSVRVAVVIPCFNDGATLEAAVTSVHAQGEPCELVVVDDGSTDPATLLVLTRLERSGTRVVHQENRGLSGARMRGVVETAAPYVHPLDADDMLAPDALTLLADALDRDPGLGMAWGDQRAFGEVEMVQRRAATLDPWAITYANRLTEGLLRREAIFAAGGWELAVGFEDWDLYMGLAEAGWRGRRVDAVTYLYRIGSSRMLAGARLQHDRLYGQMRERHPRLFAERRRNWRHSSAPLRMRLLLPAIDRLPISGFQRHRLGVAISEPAIAVRSKLSRLANRGRRR